MPGKHARLSASSAHRWTNCPGSVTLAEDKGNFTSFPAAEGTYAHHIAATCLEPLSAAKPESWLGNRTVIEGHTVECDQEMVDGVNLYLEEVRGDVEPGDSTWVEMGLLEVLQKIDPDFGGTADFVRYRPATRQVRVVDFKYGGLYVDVNDNLQLTIYALGVLLVLQALGMMVEEVELCIVQPRYHGAEPVRTFKFAAVDLLDAEVDLKGAAGRTRLEFPIFKSGDWCTFCPARRDCPVLEKSQQALMALPDFMLVEFDPGKLAAGLRLIPDVKAKIKAMEEFAYQMAAAGRFGPEYGFKLVEKRATRQWVREPAEVAKWAEERAIDPYEAPKLKSPAELEKSLAATLPRGQKKLAKEMLGDLCAPKSSGSVLVPVEDARPALTRVAAADDFDVIDRSSEPALPAPKAKTVNDLF